LPAVAGQRSETIRRSNLSTLLRELHLDGPLSRSELVARTGLTRSAVRALIGQLSLAGLVSEEVSGGLGTPGRPSQRVNLRSCGAVVLSIEIAVDSLAVAAIGLGAAVLDCIRVDRPCHELRPSQVVTELRSLVARLLRRHRVKHALVGVGVGIVGVVRRTDGLVCMAPNLAWTDVPLGEMLTDALHLPVPVVIANEADLGALAELRRGAA